ncbi:hypothetical protein [Flavisolibacter nicotianae]|uniref:hypothetical protein n=1 Tax=Flavisolibacter nicotianae TaxID=2364882 RepID=UPI000EAF1521|nr:hypothetical protein [Flavisolibacter nicotianae]
MEYRNSFGKTILTNRPVRLGLRWLLTAGSGGYALCFLHPVLLVAAGYLVVQSSLADFQKLILLALVCLLSSWLVCARLRTVTSSTNFPRRRTRTIRKQDS